MLNSLTGTITYKDQSRVLLQTGGVEWELVVSRNGAEDLPEPGEKARMFVYLHHRDDQMKLYGFAEAAERDLFQDLLRVEGVGPRQAVRILSGIRVQPFAEALEREDLEGLAAIPGLGRKTAQKILLKLRGRLTAGSPAGVSLEEDLVNALIGMGFDRRRARGAVTAAVRGLGEAGLSREEMEREAFRRSLALVSSQESS